MKQPQPLTFRGTLLVAAVGALLLFGLLALLYRESLREFVDFALIAAISFGFMSWTVLCLRLEKRMQALSLVVRALIFGFAMFCIICVGVYVRRHVTGELPRELARGSFHLMLFIPLLRACISQPPVGENDSASAPR